MDDAAEPDLIRRSIRGDEGAFCRIVRLHQRRVRTYLSRRIRDEEDAEDLAQEVFITAFRSLGGYRGDAPLGHWLMGIAHNLAIRHLQEESRRHTRESRRLTPLLASWRLRRIEGDTETPAAHERRLAALEECLRGLPPESARLVRGHYFADRSATEIARETGRREGAVRMVLLRIRTALRRCVDQRMATEGRA